MKKLFLAALVALLPLAACGSDNGSPSATTRRASPTTDETTSTTVAGLEQPAIWPAANVYFATPEEAARDFVTKVLGVPPELGSFQAGDSRSGELQVFAQRPEGSSGPKVARGVLLLRQLGARSGWFITAAVNANASIASPAARATVSAGNLTVSGKGRGFEALVVVRAFVAGDATELSKVATHGGSMETPEPFSVTLDLSKAKPGDTVMLLVRGGVGLETDPGDFGAIAILVN
jgi:hypothetical protein